MSDDAPGNSIAGLTYIDTKNNTHIATICIDQSWHNRICNVAKLVYRNVSMAYAPCEDIDLRLHQFAKTRKLNTEPIASPSEATKFSGRV